LGVQPKLTQVPPVRFRSARATVCPALAAVMAAVRPAGPPPTTTNWYTSLGRGGCQAGGGPCAVVRGFGGSNGRMVGGGMGELLSIVGSQPDGPAGPPAGPPLSGTRAETQAPQTRQGALSGRPPSSNSHRLPMFTERTLTTVVAMSFPPFRRVRRCRAPALGRGGGPSSGS